MQKKKKKNLPLISIFLILTGFAFLILDSENPIPTVFQYNTLRPALSSTYREMSSISFLSFYT